ncbi:MAG: hypothetical protein NT005_09970 [Spirochaetes bacterium]|nr:hypothetical protein [Spirochaetota bacterium]
MVGVKRVVAVAGLAAVLFGLAGCPSQFLARIKEEIAKAPFTGTNYAFVRQWGNPTPEFTFFNPLVKTDTSGYVYVADSSFRVRKFTAAGAIQQTIGLVSSQGIDANLWDIAFDASGNMYAATSETNQIQKYDASGNLILEWGGSTTYGGPALPLSTAYRSPSGIAVDSNSNVYIVDSGNNRVVKFTSSGAYQASWGGAQEYPSGFTLSSPQGIAVDSSNNVYVVDSGINHRVLKFNSSLSPTAEWGRLATDFYPPSTGSLLSNPKGISVSAGSPQNVYVVDNGNDRIVKFSTGGSYQTVWGTQGPANGQFDSPGSVAVDTSGFVYISDEAGMWGRIQKFDTSTPPAWVASWVLDSTPTDGLFTAPWGVAFDPSGNIYVDDLFNGRAQKFDSLGNFSAKVLSQGTSTTPFQWPMGLAIDASGSVYVLEMMGSRIQKFESSLNYVTTWGGWGPGQKQFKNPTALAVDASGNIFVADALNHRVQVLDSTGNYLREWGSTAGIPPADGQFDSIYGIAVDSGGNVYVSDMGLHRIQKFDSQGTFLAKWEYQGTGDGQFINPVGLAVDAIGNVYVCDLGNRRIEKFDSSGKFLAKFGGVGVGNGTFSWPVAVAVNSSGHVVVSDYTGNLVQEFEPTF